MDHHNYNQLHNEQLTTPIHKPKLHRLSNGVTNGGAATSPPSIWLEIRLFYVRIFPCAIDALPDHLTLRHLRQDLGVSLEINGGRVPASEKAAATLRRDRVDRDSAEVTYVSTDNVRVSGGVGFEVYEKDSLLLCGTIGRFENEWGIDFYHGGTSSSSNSAFFQPKLGISSPSIEVYVAGRWCDTPVILTKMINVSPRRKSPRYRTLDVIPEVSDEIEKDRKLVMSDSLRQRKLEQLTASEDEYDAQGKMMHNWYPEEVYGGEDGQLTWFNAGVRVGVGISLGMCVGIGIGVGLLMRSYQATTRNFRRRFF